MILATEKTRVPMKKLWLAGVMAFAVLANHAVYAEDDEGLATVKATLSVLMPKAQADSVTKSAIPGMYEAVFGAQVIYVSADGRFMLEGDLYDLQRRVNLTEEKRQSGRVKAMESLDEASMIVFSPKSETKYTITAFTDIDCGYCRKLHKEMKDYNDLGITIRYASYPRSGLNTPSYEKAVAVWCAVDRNKAMNFAKGGASLEQLQAIEQVKDKNCKDPIKLHMQVASMVGVSGTPTLVMQDGSVLPGYVPAQRLLQILEDSAKNTKAGS